jgi:flagellar protein FliT
MPNLSLSYYESIGRVSEMMLCAARAGDWNALIDAEHCCAALIARLQLIDPGTGDLDAPGLRRKEQIIRRVLAEDAEIRDITQPWLHELDLQLGTAQRRRAAESAYR